MTEQLDELWGTDTGLIDDFDFDVERAFFTTDAKYNQGQSLILRLEGSTSDTDNPSYTVDFPCGSDWESHDAGKTATHPNGKVRFQKNSRAGLLVEKALELGAGATLKAKGTPPTVASTWEGTRWHFKRTKVDYGGEIGTKEFLLPTAFLGTGSGSATAAAPTAAPAPAAPAGDPALVATLTALAQSKASHAEFVQAAMAVDGVMGDDTLMASVVDATASGFYAQAQATAQAA